MFYGEGLTLTCDHQLPASPKILNKEKKTRKRKMMIRIGRRRYLGKKLVKKKEKMIWDDKKMIKIMECGK